VPGPFQDVIELEKRSPHNAVNFKLGMVRQLRIMSKIGLPSTSKQVQSEMPSEFIFPVKMVLRKACLSISLEC
jgi:hypothetical protein